MTETSTFLMTETEETFKRNYLVSGDGMAQKYYADTGCNYLEDVKNMFYIRTSCPMNSAVDAKFAALLQKPLKEFGNCPQGTEPKDVLIDFAPFYYAVLNNSQYDGGALMRDYNDKTSSKKIMMIITRLTSDSTGTKECVVYDNLNSNAYRMWTDTDTYFDLYRGGESIKDHKYGPRIKLPLCEDTRYKVTLVYIDGTLSMETDRTYTSVWDWATQEAVASQAPSVLAGDLGT
jgi:hypothetical protein